MLVARRQRDILKLNTWIGANLFEFRFSSYGFGVNFHRRGVHPAANPSAGLKSVRSAGAARKAQILMESFSHQLSYFYQFRFLISPLARIGKQRNMLRMLPRTNSTDVRQVADEVRLVFSQSMAISREADDEALVPPLAAA